MVQVNVQEVIEKARRPIEIISDDPLAMEIDLMLSQGIGYLGVFILVGVFSYTCHKFDKLFS